jgi:hypothetical protein
MKNFLEHESIQMEIMLSIPMVDKLISLSKYQPSNSTQKHLDTLLQSIFVDLEPEGPDNTTAPPILYEIASSAILELNGEKQTYSMSINHFNLLLYISAADVDDATTLLHLLNCKYRIFQTDHPRTYVNDFSGYILFMFEENMDEITTGRDGDDAFMEDVTLLLNLITEVIDEGCFRLEYVNHYVELCYYMSNYVIKYVYVVLCYYVVLRRFMPVYVYVVYMLAFIRQPMSKALQSKHCVNQTYQNIPPMLTWPPSDNQGIT